MRVRGVDLTATALPLSASGQQGRLAALNGRRPLALAMSTGNGLHSSEVMRLITGRLAVPLAPGPNVLALMSSLSLAAPLNPREDCIK